jgi:(p)ppGpp synthase/HD superfamily hydrolase
MTDRGRIERAFLLASELHAGQLRKRTRVPYIFHLMAVAALVAEYGGDEDQIVALAAAERV